MPCAIESDVALWPHMKEMPLANKIRSLKKGQSFQVKTKSQRETVCRIVRTLSDCGYLPLKIVTVENSDKKGFTVSAV